MPDSSAEPATALAASWRVDRVLADSRRRNRRASFVAWLLALVLLLTLAGVLSAAGVLPSLSSGDTSRIATTAGSTGTAQPTASDAHPSSGRIVAAWDGPATHLDWSGRAYSTAEAAFVGERIATPGDRTRRTLLLTNDGPSRAGLAVSLRVAEVMPDSARNPGLADELELFWNVGGIEGRQPFSALLDASVDTVDTVDTVEIAEVQVAQGETVAVEIGFELPATTARQSAEGNASTELAFDVVATLSGDVDDQPRRLATTGADSLLLFGIAAGLLLLLGLLLLARPRRRCDDCSRTIARDESWVDLEQQHGVGRYRVCPDCALLHDRVARAS